MDNLKYFQRYHGKENTHSSNALSLLHMLYDYNPKKFYSTLGALIESQGDLENAAPSFVVQDTKNGKGSIPDFSIMQHSFKIAVEAKEGAFNVDQLDRHLKGLSEKGEFAYKVLIALSPQNDVQHHLDKLKVKYPNICIVHKTYMDFYNTIFGNLHEIKDCSFIEILNEYKDYCELEGLIDYSEDTLMVRSTTDTYDFNFQNGVYYDSTKCTPLGFRYLGLYKEKSVKAIGKITKIVEAHVDETGAVVYGDLMYGRTLTDEDKRKVELAIDDRKNKYHNETDPHWHFIVEKFVEVVNFRKKKYGLYGKKKFYLKEDFEMNDIAHCTIEDIASAMQDYNKWD